MNNILIEGLEMPVERESFNLTIKYNGLVFDTETGIQVATAHNLEEISPVIRGHWIDTDNYFYRWRCSVCRCHTKDSAPPYCPNCGAFMEET